MVAAATTRSQRHPGSLLDENAEHLLCERATMERIKARRLLLPDLAHNDAPTVPDSAATRESTAAFAEAVGHDAHRGPRTGARADRQLSQVTTSTWMRC